jgi:hypothetical protein
MEWSGSTKSRGHGKDLELEELREGVVVLRLLSEAYLRGVGALVAASSVLCRTEGLWRRWNQ